MKGFAKDRALAPYELPEELHYLTPPPLWQTAPAGPAERGQPGTVGGVPVHGAEGNQTRRASVSKIHRTRKRPDPPARRRSGHMRSGRATP